jgi:hypothetical protein
LTDTITDIHPERIYQQTQNPTSLSPGGRGVGCGALQEQIVMNTILSAKA